MAMVERCPSGALIYTLEPDGDLVKPDLQRGIAITPDGPLWASGGITVERVDGRTLETRDWVTLCHRREQAAIRRRTSEGRFQSRVR